MSVIIEDQIAEADRVVTRITLRGSHQEEFQGLAPTGKLVTVGAIAINHIAHGQIVEHWVATYSPSLFEQLKASAP